ncbi:ribose-phosphate diphosphokinase [Candidatus Woesearchaeota archaeon]|nr:ribose-phosphate diphosphokinase [Candidatus Woesearchaeota archaeon]
MNSDLELAVYDLSPLPEGAIPEGLSREEEEKRRAELLATNPNTKFSRNICKILGIKPSEVDIKKFKDGETDPEIKESVRNKKIFVFQSYIDPLGERKYELELFLDGVIWGGSHKNGPVVVFPYAFGARGERRTEPRKAAPTLVWARSLGVFGAETLLTGAIHAESVEMVYNACGVYFEDLEFRAVAANYILRNYQDKERVAVLSPDEGGAKRVRKIENFLNYDGEGKVRDIEGLEDLTLNIKSGSADKIRKKDDEVESADLSISVDGYDVIIIDDIGDTLGTLETAATNCRNGGAKSVRAFLFHPSLGKGYEEKMKEMFDKGIVDEIILGNTVPIKDYARNHPQVKVLPLEPLYAEAITRIHHNLSISELHTYEGVMEIYDKARHLFKGDPKYVKIGRIKLPTLDS